MPMYAIIEESGGQRKVTEGEVILIDLYKGGESAAGETVTFDKVLVVGNVGGDAKFGQPLVSGAKVTASVLEPVVMGDKIHIYKMRPKKHSRTKTGHRQRYTKVKIEKIAG